MHVYIYIYLKDDLMIKNMQNSIFRKILQSKRCEYLRIDILCKCLFDELSLKILLPQQCEQNWEVCLSRSKLSALKYFAFYGFLVFLL